MDNYEKPMAKVMDSKTEGIYMASGKVLCRFGRTEWNRGADTCQSCAASNGTQKDLKAYRKDATYCIDNMPEKTDQNSEESEESENSEA
jgi:hypothetical protein